MACRKKKCLEAAAKAALLEGRGPQSPQPKVTDHPKIDPNEDRWINASGGITVSKKYKKGIIQ